MNWKLSTKQSLRRCIAVYAPVFLLLIGLMYMGRNFFYNQAVSRRPLYNLSAVLPSPVAAKEIIYGRPAQLSLPRIGINLGIAAGYYDASSRSWTLDDIHAFWMTNTPQLTSRSHMTVIYGHDEDSVFGHLNLLQPGDQLTITTAEGSLVTLRYRNDAVVEPTDSGVTQSGDATVALITCTGNYYQHRRVMYFDYVSVLSPKAKAAS